MNTIAGLGHGLQKGAENMLNLPTDMVGWTNDKGERLFEFDWVDRRENNTYFDVISGVTQFISGLPIGGPMAKGATKLAGYGMKSLRGVDHVKKAQRARQVGKSGVAYKSGQRITAMQTLKQESLNGLLRGYMADFAAFNGDESMLLGFFRSHPELHTAYKDISSQEGWENRSSEDLAAETMGQFSQAMHNIRHHGYGGSPTGRVLQRLLAVYEASGDSHQTNSEGRVWDERESQEGSRKIRDCS